MARLFPKIDPKEIANPGERDVAKALLEQLPRRVEVFHGFNWLVRTVTDTFQGGDVTASWSNPKRLLFVEVKEELVVDGTRRVGRSERSGASCVSDHS